MYRKVVHNMEGVSMETVSVNKFRSNMKSFVEQVIMQHLPLKVARRKGKDFVVISSEN